MVWHVVLNMGTWESIGTITGALLGVGAVLSFVFGVLYRFIIKKFIDQLITQTVAKIDEKFDDFDKRIRMMEDGLINIQENANKRIEFNRCILQSLMLILRKLDNEKLNGDIKAQLKELDNILLHNIL
jgi:hypothetical protein